MFELHSIIVMLGITLATWLVASILTRTFNYNLWWTTFPIAASLMAYYVSREAVVGIETIASAVVNTLFVVANAIGYNAWSGSLLHDRFAGRSRWGLFSPWFGNSANKPLDES